jgi:hypothetical protein
MQPVMSALLSTHTDILARLATSFAVPILLTVVGREAILLVLGL